MSSRVSFVLFLLALSSCVRPPQAKSSPPDTCADADNDGVCAVADKCPDQQEDYDGFEDDDGCPDFDHDPQTIMEEEGEP